MIGGALLCWVVAVVLSGVAGFLCVDTGGEELCDASNTDPLTQNGPPPQS